MDIPKFAPGCFGSSIAFSTDDICKNCSFFEACQNVHFHVTQELRKKYGITVPKTKRRVKVNLNGDTTLALPIKTQNVLNKLETSAEDICSLIKKNINPFQNKGPKYLSLLCHLLIREKQPIKSEFLITAFMTKFSWKEETARVHVRIATQILEHIGAIKRIDGTIFLELHEEDNETMMVA